MQPTSSRQAYLDWLRILSISCVFFLHSGMAYVEEWGWHIKDQHTSHLLMEVNFQLSRFRMPLLFFISGTVTWFMIQKRTTSGFIGLRFRRLFLPLLFGMLIVVPPQVYMERLTQGFKGNYADFYPTVFTTGVYPKGNLSWHHLWFILYLFLYDIIFARFFKWSTGEQGQLKMAFFNKLATRKWIYLLILPSVVWFTSLTLSFPETHDLIHDWCRLAYWLLFLLAGFVCVNFPALLDSLERNRRTSLLFLFITMIAINYIRWNNLEPDEVIPNWRHDWRTYLFLPLYPLAAWASIFTAIGYAKRYLNKKHRILNYLNEAVYPFYILHQTVIVIIAYYVVQCTEAVAVKFIFTFVTALVVTVCIYHLLIRPYGVTRFLFGMKAKGASAKPQETSEDTIRKAQETTDKTQAIVEPAV